MFEYPFENIKKDIHAYIEGGCFQNCCQSSYVPKLKADLAQDFAILKQEIQTPDFKSLPVYFEDYIDYAETSRQKKTIFKMNDFLTQCKETFGNDYQNILTDTQVISDKGKLNYLEAISHTAGRCHTSKDNKNSVIFIALDDINPLSSAFVTYHEFAHALEKSYKLQEDDKTHLMISHFEQQLKKSEPQDSPLRNHLKGLYSHQTMNKECFADTFAFAVMMIKTKASPRIEHQLLNENAATFCYIMEDSKHDSAYCSFPIMLSVADKIRRDFLTNNTDFYYTQEGNINFKNIARLAHHTVKHMAYDHEEYFDLADFAYLNDEEKRFVNKDERYYQDYLQAKKYLQEHRSPQSKEIAARSLLLRIKSAPHNKLLTTLDDYSNSHIKDDLPEIREKIENLLATVQQQNSLPLAARHQILNTAEK